MSPFMFVISITSFITKVGEESNLVSRLVSRLASLPLQYPHLSPTYQVILIAVHVVHIIIEVVRLYLGFSGNLGEKIPALSGFWITSLLLQLPITLFLAVNREMFPFPAEVFLYSLHVIFLLTQLFFGFSVIQNIAAFHVRMFKEALKEEEEGDLDKAN